MNIFIDAVRNLCGNKGWSIQEPPKTEAEFLGGFNVQVGADENNVAIMSNDPADFGFTYSDLQVEIARLEADYAAKQYQRERAAEYPSFADQFDMLYHGGYDAWKSAIDAVKQKYPKPE